MHLPTTDSARTHAGQTAAMAIEALYEEQSEAIFRLGLDLLRGDPEAAEDLVQETFLAAFQGWDGFRGNSKPSTWLYTIARRTAWRMRRLRAGEPRHLEAFDEVNCPAEHERCDENDPLAALIAEEEERRLHEALDALPARYRLPVSLKELGGLSVSDVAETLDLCEGTVKSRLHRGRDRLAVLLEPTDQLVHEAA